mgnify:FL=1
MHTYMFNSQAAFNGAVEVLHWLLDKGADPNSQDCKL